MENDIVATTVHAKWDVEINTRELSVDRKNYEPQP